ncbi:hypothetical protein RB195_004376 [Necator americanus]|uniref:Uncharacterized protein n=1 Tax=Necator americanus TaxID=51031 RepID=A0ABR1BHP4_NECAM
MASDTYQKVIHMVDATVRSAGELLKQLQDHRVEPPVIETKKIPIKITSQGDSCKTASFTTSSSLSAHTPPYSRSELKLKSKKLESKKRSSYATADVCVGHEDGGDIRIIHADNVYINCDSDGFSAEMSDFSQSSKRSKKRRKLTGHMDTALKEISLEKKEAGEVKADEKVQKDLHAMQGDSKSAELKKITPKAVTPKTRSTSTSTSKKGVTEKQAKKSKSYLKETITRTEIITTKEFPGDIKSLDDATKGTVKKREVKTTSTVNIYPEDKVAGQLVPGIETRNYTTTEILKKPGESGTVEPFSRFVLGNRDQGTSSGPSQKSEYAESISELSSLLKTAVEQSSNISKNKPSSKPRDPYRPPKVSQDSTVEKLSAVHKVNKESDKSAEQKKIKATKKTLSHRESENTTRTESSIKAERTPAQQMESPRTMPPWGLPSREDPTEMTAVKKHSKAKSTPSTLQYTSSQSSLIGKSYPRKTPPSAKRHKKKKEEGFTEAGKSESYLERTLKYAIAGRKPSKTRQARQGSDEVKVHSKKSDESSRSSSSVKAIKLKSKLKKETSTRARETTSDTECITTARSSTPRKDSPILLPPWGMPSAETPVELTPVKKHGKAQSPPSTLQYSSSQSSLIGKSYHRKTPPSGKRHKRKKKEEEFREAGKSESYLERTLKYAVAGRKLSKKHQVRKARESIKESRKSMKAKDVEKRSAKTFKNPVTPRYLKPKYKIPEEFKIERKSAEEYNTSVKSESNQSSGPSSEFYYGKGEETPLSSTKSDGSSHMSGFKSSKKKKKKMDGKKREEDGRGMVAADKSESYLEHVNEYAIAGRKVKRKSPPKSSVDIWRKRENIKESRKMMKKGDVGRVYSKEFVTNPAKPASLGNIMKRQQELAAHLVHGSKDRDSLSEAADVESRTVVHDHSLPPPTSLSSLGRPYRRMERARVVRRMHKRLRKKPKKRSGFQPATESKSWLEHSLKFATAGEMARKKKEEEAEAMKSDLDNFEPPKVTSVGCQTGNSKLTGSDDNGSVSMDDAEKKCEVEEQRSKASYKRSRSKSTGRSMPSIASSLKAESESPLQTASTGLNTPQYSNVSYAHPTINKSGQSASESPFELTSAGHNDITSAPVDSRLLTSSRSGSKSRKKCKSHSRQSIPDENIENVPNISLPVCKCSHRSHVVRSTHSRAPDDIRFDVKFQLRDIDTNLEHTLNINGYFIDKKLKRLTLNGKFCQL